LLHRSRIPAAWGEDEAMKDEQSDNYRVWTGRRAIDGCIYEQFDPWLLARIKVGNSLHNLADGLVIAAGRRNIEKTRAW
jgi:hypothetical protein